MDVVFLNGGIVVWEKDIFARSIGPYKIAHWVRKHGYSVQVIDHITKLTETQLYKIVKKFITKETLVVGISATFLCGNEFAYSDGTKKRIPEHVLNILKHIKDEYPNIKIVIGGYKADHVPNWDVIDATVMSYTVASEDIFLEYVNHLKFGSEPPYGQIQPMMDDDERMVYDRARNPVYNIEMDDFRFIKQDAILPIETLPLDVSRGCIFACKFCQFTHLGKGKLDYVRGMEYLEQELIHNYENFGTTTYWILDDTFNDTEWKLKNFHAMTERLPFKIQYCSYLRTDLVHRYPDMAYLLQESGLVGAFLGMETLHPSASKIIGKAWNGKHARDYVPKLYHDIWKRQVGQNLGFMVGLPDDTKESILDTVKWFQDNELHHILFAPLYLTGPLSKNNIATMQSEFDRNSEKYGITFVDEVNWVNNNWTRQSSIDFANEVVAMIKPTTKLTTWLIPTVLKYGYDKDFILSTPHVKLPWAEMKIKTDAMYKIYYDMLMNL